MKKSASEVLLSAIERCSQQSEEAMAAAYKAIQPYSGESGEGEVHSPEEIVSILREAADKFELVHALVAIQESLFDVPVECPRCGNRFYPKPRRSG